MYQIIVRFTPEAAAKAQPIANRPSSTPEGFPNIRIYHMVPGASRDLTGESARDYNHYQDVKTLMASKLIGSLCQQDGVLAAGIMETGHGIAILGRADTEVSHLNWEERNLFASDPAYTLFLGDE